MSTSESTGLDLIGALRCQFFRHLKVHLASPVESLNPLLFFLMVVTLFPIGLGPEPEVLMGLSPGILWVVTLLASLMASTRLFGSDYEDGSMEQLALSSHPLAVLALAEVAAHWLSWGSLLIISSPIFAMMLGMPSSGIPILMASLLMGTMCLALIGALGSALTLSIRRGGLLMSLIIIPLNVPVLIFGTSALNEALLGGAASNWLALLGALALASLALAPFAIGAALRISLDT